MDEERKARLEDFCEHLGVKLAEDYIAEQEIRKTRDEKLLRKVLLYGSGFEDFLPFFIVAGKMLNRLQERNYDSVEVVYDPNNNGSLDEAYVINIQSFIDMFKRAKDKEREIIV